VGPHVDERSQPRAHAPVVGADETQPPIGALLSPKSIASGGLVLESEPVLLAQRWPLEDPRRKFR